jgi:hypothetical protein
VDYGLGRALLWHSFGEFYPGGTTTTGLGVDSANLTGATRLYQRAGLWVASEFALCEKEMRDVARAAVRDDSTRGDDALEGLAALMNLVFFSGPFYRAKIGLVFILITLYNSSVYHPGGSMPTSTHPTLPGARQLAKDDRYQFQWWALSLIGARPVGGEAGSKQGKKGADGGIDGVINFIDDAKGKPSSVIVQVNSGHVKSGDILELRGVVEQNQAAIGVFITLEPPTRDMQTAAVTAGYYQSPVWNQQYPRIQVITIEQLLDGAQVKMPPSPATFKKAEKIKKSEGKQGELGL